MERIISIFIVSLLLFTTSCEKPEPPVIAKIAIEQADVDFSSRGGEGNVVVISEKAFTVKCEQEWLKFTVSGKKISFTVLENKKIDGRNALLEISDGTDELVLTITQMGTISISELKSFTFAYGQRSAVFKLESDLDMTVTSSAEWLTTEWKKETGELIVRVSEAQEKARKAKVLVESNLGHRWVADFIQHKKFVGGEFLMDYISSNKPYQASCKIEPTDTPNIFNLNFIFANGNKVSSEPVKAEIVGSKLVIKSNQYLGKLTNGDAIWLSMIDFSWPKDVFKGYTTNAAPDILYGAVLNYDKNGDFVLQFRDQKTWKGRNTNGLSFRLVPETGKQSVRANFVDIKLSVAPPPHPLVGEYKMKYNLSASPELTEGGKCRIFATKDPAVFDVYFVLHNGFKHDRPIKAKFEKNILTLASLNDALDQLAENNAVYTLRLQMIDLFRKEDGSLGGATSGNIQNILYAAKLNIEKETKKISLKFQDVGSWKGQKVNGLGFVSYPDKPKKDLKAKTYAYICNVELEK